MRRGFALMDAIVGGMVLGIALGVVLTLASRSVAAQTRGQDQLVASWLLDELLGMVLVEGPEAYPQLHPTEGQFEPPFDRYEYDLDIEDTGLRTPFLVTATVRWPQGRQDLQVQAQTYIAGRIGDPVEFREPLEPIDRIGRYYEDE